MCSHSWSMTSDNNLSNNIYKYHHYRNPNFGLTTKAKACKSVGQEGGPGGTSYIPGSLGECERMNLHALK